MVKEFAAQNLLVDRASTLLRLRYYDRQQALGQLIIDGGFGELARRQYLNRIVRFGKKALFSYDCKTLLSLMRVHRADIFHPYFTQQLLYEAEQSLEATLRNMPNVADIGVENFIDLLSIRTRVPNFGGPEQARSDALVMNYMPMVQPSFLREVFLTDVKERRNGNYLRRMVRNRQSELQRFPLVKSGTTYPYFFSHLIATVYTKAKNKITGPFIDPTPNVFLQHMKECVLDIVNSGEVKMCEMYDYEKITHKVEAYYNGDSSLQSYVDWWLSFEMWRRSIQH